MPHRFDLASVKFRSVLAFLIIVAASSVTFAQRSAPNRPGAVRGRVLYGDTSNPVRKANVSLVPLDRDDKPATTTTDRQGEFNFASVEPGRYLAVADASNLVSPYAAGGQVELKERWQAGQTVPGCAEVIVISSGAAKVEIVGLRGGAITGQIRSGDGEPIPGAKVKLFEIRNGQPISFDSIHAYENNRLGSNESDDQGNYRIGGLPSGKYLVMVADGEVDQPMTRTGPASPRNQSFVVSYFPAARTLKEAEPVDVVAGKDTTGINLNLIDVQAHSASGTVIFGPAGVPLFQFYLELYRSGEPTPLTYWPVDNPEGSWRVDGLPDGKYVLVLDTRFTPGLRDSNGGSNVVNVLPARQEFAIKGADVDDLVMTVDQGSALRGQVRVAGPKPDSMVLYVEVIPVARDSKVRESRAGANDGTIQTMVESDGRFLFRSLAPGPYLLRLASSAVKSAYLSSVTLDGKDVTGEPIQLGSKQELKDVTVSVSTNLASVQIVVVNGADKTPVKSALVAMMPVSELQRKLMPVPILSRTSDNGRLTMRVPPGEYYLFAMRNKANDPITLDDTFWRDNSPKLTRLKLSAGDNLDNFTLPLEAEPKK